MTELIPAIDLIEGRCVRLTQGDYADKKVYEQEPVDMAKMYADCGVRRLHVVDLDGAKAKEPCNLRVLERLATETSLDIEWGGGIKSTEALRSAINAGANRVICGSVAVDNAELFASWLQSYGAEHYRRMAQRVASDNRQYYRAVPALRAQATYLYRHLKRWYVAGA